MKAENTPVLFFSAEFARGAAAGRVGRGSDDELEYLEQGLRTSDWYAGWIAAYRARRAEHDKDARSQNSSGTALGGQRGNGTVSTTQGPQQ